jgi:hypothetical protein
VVSFLAYIENAAGSSDPAAMNMGIL